MRIREIFVDKGLNAVYSLEPKPPFHGSNRGSNPRGDAKKTNHKIQHLARYPRLPRVPSIHSKKLKTIAAHGVKRTSTRRFVKNS